ncbi:hypothetical protein BDQ17DRAFT_1434237 [Cyathus striatus]|nr:hypothetical protein BDQ17DRAFT_1434237 [Cyathus striatus]
MSTALRGLSRSHTMLGFYTRALPTSFTRPPSPFYRTQITQLAALSSTSRKYKNHERHSTSRPPSLPPLPPPPGNKFSYIDILRVFLRHFVITACGTIFVIVFSGLLLDRALKQSLKSEHQLSLKRFILDEQPNHHTFAEMSKFFKAIHEFLNKIAGKKKYDADPTWE